MKRSEMMRQLETTAEWDMVIIGGGATGLGAAVDASSRGLKTLLIERADFAKGTSSRSTKLVHGGVRYLAQGNIKLVKEALRERGFLLKNAAHICSVQPFIIPVYTWFDLFFYGIGLKVYDLLSGKLSLGATKVLSKANTLEKLPSLQSENLKGSIVYFDGQFDDSRLAIDLAYTACHQGATILNYVSLKGFKKENNKIIGIECTDELTGKEYVVHGKSFINATGVFTDHVMKLDEVDRDTIVHPSQGIHLVVSRSFFKTDHALMIPKTSDGRVFFAVPWHNEVVLGTTDTAIDLISEEPRPLEEEIDFIITHFNKYNAPTIERKDVQSVYVGLRPLVKMSGTSSTALLSRDHNILVSPSGLVTITGGKWTTYRKMAEDAVNNALFISKQPKMNCVTVSLKIGDPDKRNSILESIILEDASYANCLHNNYPYTIAEVIFAIRYELAQTVEDILARRTRLLFLNAGIAKELAPLVARLLAKELKHNSDWEQKQIEEFEKLSSQYIPSWEG